MTSCAFVQARSVLQNPKMGIVLKGWTFMPVEIGSEAYDNWVDAVGKPISDVLNGTMRRDLTLDDIKKAMDGDNNGEPVLDGYGYVLLHNMFVHQFQEKKRNSGHAKLQFTTSSNLGGSGRV